MIAPSLLLDTHALLWWLVEPEKLCAIAQAAINDPQATIVVSAASAWEIATKVRLGKRPGAERRLQGLPALPHQEPFHPLHALVHHGVHGGGDRQVHRDPFDRLLAAQAELEGLQLVNLDPALASFPCRLLW